LADTVSFDVVGISLASPRDIRAWSRGEVKKPETINYRTFKPERDGLFCERIFGPSRDWECHCGKYKKVKFKGIVCDRCGVEVTRAKVRRRRMGHIELSAPVCHIWYLKGVPSPISLLLDVSARLLEKVVYFASYMVTEVEVERLHARRDNILQAVEEEKVAVQQAYEELVDELKRSYEEGLKRQQEAAREAAAREAAREAAGETEEEDEEGLLGTDLLGALAGGGFGDSYGEPQPMSEEELAARIEAEKEAARERIADLERAAKTLFDLAPKQLISEIDYRSLMALVQVCGERLGAGYDSLFQAGLGAAAVRDLLKQIDLDELSHELRKEVDERTGARRLKAIKRLQVVEAFRKSKNRPEWMVLEAIPVLPPELRPMVQLDGGRFATSDLNDLYRRIINRNNRLRRIVDIKAPESIVNHEKRLLQEAVDALIDNSRRARPVTGTNKRALKSLSDMLKGKEGRFRKNLLGKRVDYSGRSVIVVGPELKLHQAGIPREMALELFKPFVMKRLVDQQFTSNIKTAKRMVDRLKSEVWDALEDVIQDHPVLLNRAPTLHRLGIQAFEPVLIDGKAIQLHPLVCHAFNADFDGDQMAVHVPLSAHAQAEATLLMLSARNLFKPADGRPVAAPLYDVVLGCYYMTQENPGGLGSGKIFETGEAVDTAYQHDKIDLHATIKVRLPLVFVEARVGGREGEPVELDPALRRELRRLTALHRGAGHPVPPCRCEFTLTKGVISGKTERPADPWVAGLIGRAVQAVRDEVLPAGVWMAAGVRRELVDTTVGRVLFNTVLPLDMRFKNHDIAKEELAETVDECFRIYGEEKTAELLDELKAVGFRYATRSGLSISLRNIDLETDRDNILRETDDQVSQVYRGWRDGAITAGEREKEVLNLWREARERVADSILDRFEHSDRFNPLWMMTNSGARAKRSHISQICGMRGLMSDPFGRMIEDLPVRSNFQEGLNVLEYFVSTHGARKGLADVALRTADAGYLTRRLVDVAQDVIIREIDCGTEEGIVVHPMYETEEHCRACGAEDLYRRGTCQECGAAFGRALDDKILQPLSDRVIGRIAARDIIHPETGEIIVARGREITEELAAHVEAAHITAVTIRSPLTCELRQGICAMCYGRDLATRRLADVGTAVGIVAAQSIGEPGTQLTMRTFHTGGVAAQYLTGVADVKKKKQEALQSLQDDIRKKIVRLDETGGERERNKQIQEMLKVLETPVHGLLRVVELFEARKPKGQAITSAEDGLVAEIQQKGLRRLVIHTMQSLDDPREVRGKVAAETVVQKRTAKVLVEEGEKITEKVLKRLKKAGRKRVKVAVEHLVPWRGRLYVEESQEIRAGDRLTAGPLDPQQVLRLKGIRGVQEYLLREIQAVYRSQGVTINDKHIEVIVRQMLRKRKIKEHGDTDFLAGQIADRFAFEDENARVQAQEGQEATADWVLLGITEASLATESFLSAASFQRTTRVLAEAAVAGKKDPLLGLKENVIIGRLIPAGCGMPLHRDKEVGYSEEVIAQLEAMPPELDTPPPDLVSEAQAALQAAPHLREAMERLGSLGASSDLGAGLEDGGDDLLG